jgi:uncharacterized membrane protein
MTTPRVLAALFALYASLAVLLLALDMPPFMNPDEGAHAERADAIAHLGLMAGGADTGIAAALQPFRHVIAHPDQKVTPAMYAPVPWGERTQAVPANTAIYPPIFYLPAAASIRAGQWAGWSVLPTLTLARLATGLVSVAIAAPGVAMAESGALWLFAILLLPMSLGQMAALSQDGPMIGTAALATGLYINLLCSGRAHWRGAFVAMNLALACLAMGRPPYAALAILPLTAPGVPRAARCAGCGFVLAATAGWCWVAATRSGVDMGNFGEQDPAAQLRFLLHQPWDIFSIGWNTLHLYSKDYIVEFIGQLGWLDVPLPSLYHKAAVAMLALAACACWAAGSGARARAWPVVMSIAAGSFGIFLIEYLTWTEVGADVVMGIQGRYFLVLTLVAGGILTKPWAAPTRATRWLAAPVLLFPILSIATVSHYVGLRYH